MASAPSVNWNHHDHHPWRIFRTLSFVNSLFVGVTGPLEVIFLASVGLNPARIGFVMAMQGIGLVLSDIPTGAFADRYGRKASLVLSFLVLGLVFVGWTFARSFVWLSLLSLLWGVGYAFQSGAKTALIIESMRIAEDDRKRDRTFARLAIYGQYGLLLGGFIAAALAGYSLQSIWAAAAVLNIFMAVVVWLGLSPDRRRTDRSSVSSRRLWSVMIDNIRMAFMVPRLRLIILLGTVSTLAISAYSLAWPLFFKQQWHTTSSQFGLLGSLAAGMGIIGAIIVNRLSKRHGYRFTALVVAACLVPALFLLVRVRSLALAIALYALVELMVFGWDPIEQSLINRVLPDDRRATMLSIGSSVNLVVRTLAQLGTGVVLLATSTSGVLASLGILFLGWPLIITRLVAEHPPTMDEKNHPATM